MPDAVPDPSCCGEAAAAATTGEADEPGSSGQQTAEEQKALVEAAEREQRNRGLGEHGCKHYRRRCRMVGPCCGEVFWCRHCHNEAKTTNEWVRPYTHKFVLAEVLKLPFLPNQTSPRYLYALQPAPACSHDMRAKYADNWESVMNLPHLRSSGPSGSVWNNKSWIKIIYINSRLKINQDLYQINDQSKKKSSATRRPQNLE